MADGQILINTKIGTDGMEKGASAIKKNLNSISALAAKTGDIMKKALSGADVPSAVSNAALRVKGLERQLTAVSEKLKVAISADDDKAAERLGDKQVALYDRLEVAREKLAFEAANAARKQTEAERQEAEKQKLEEERKTEVQRREAEERQKIQTKEQTALSKSMNRFGVRLRGIVGSALVFNIISAGLRGMTQYFGNALKANDEFSKALSQLKGALLTAFQPIYNAVAPALTYLVQLATMAVQAIALLFATLSGTTLENSKEAAENLYKQADGYKAAGAAAKKASKQIAAFDEIQKLNNDTASGGGGGGSSGSTMPSFSFDALPRDLEAFIERLAFNIQEILFDWSDWQEGDIVKKIVEGLSILGGAAIGFAVGGPAGAAIGAAIGLGITFFITSIVPDEEFAAIEKSFSGFFGTIEAWLTGDWDGMIENFNAAWEGFLTSNYWSGENSLGSLLLDWVGIDFEAIRQKLLGYIGEGGSIYELFRKSILEFEEKLMAATGGIFNILGIRPFGALSALLPEEKTNKKLPSGARDVLGVGDSLRDSTELEFSPLAKQLGKVFDEAKKKIDEFTAWVNGIPAEIETSWGEVADFFKINITDPINNHFKVLQAATELIWGTIGDIINGEWDKVLETWGPVAVWFDENVIKPVAEFFAGLWGAAPGQATEAWEGIKTVFATVGQFFSDTFGGAWGDILDVFSDGGDIFTDIKDGIVTAFKSIVNKLISGINSVVSKPFSSINTALRKIKGIDILGIKPFSGISTITVPSIPYLAQGAVLPANKPFMAVVGDQKHGTNVEAPLTTIQEAVANVMDGHIVAMMAGFEALLAENRALRETVEGIELGDKTIAEAAARYNRKWAVVRGY